MKLYFFNSLPDLKEMNTDKSLHVYALVAFLDYHIVAIAGPFIKTHLLSLIKPFCHMK